MQLSGIARTGYNLAGLGLAPGPDSSPTCGDSPCTFSDYLYTSDPCYAYLKCADPTNILAGSGLVNTAASAVGQTVASTTSGLSSGVASGLGIPSWLLAVGVIAAAFVVLKAK